jgi:hypothetical protein
VFVQFVSRVLLSSWFCVNGMLRCAPCGLAVITILRSDRSARFIWPLTPWFVVSGSVSRLRCGAGTAQSVASQASCAPCAIGEYAGGPGLLGSVFCFFLSFPFFRHLLRF